MNRTPRSQPPPMVAASRIVSHIVAIAIEAAVLPFVGYWCDKHYGLSPWLFIVGIVLGGGVAVQHMVHLARASDKSNRQN